MAEKALKTSVFIWEGTDKKGAKVKGELTGQNPMLVKAHLRKQGINPLKVRKKGISLLGAGKKVKPMDIALFTRQMATMMGAGVPSCNRSTSSAKASTIPTCASWWMRSSKKCPRATAWPTH